MASIEQRSENTWRLTGEGGLNPDGSRKRERKPITIEDKKLLKSPKKLQDYLSMELLKFKAELEAGEYIKPNKISFSAFVEDWRKNYANQNLGEYTRLNYLGFIKSHLIPEFGQMEMGRIKTMHIVNFMSKLRTPEARKDGKNKPLSTNTIMNIYKALKSIFDNATKWGIIPKNPMEGVDRPSMDKKEKKQLKSRKRYYTHAESEKVLAALYDEPENWRLYFIGVLLGGFRRGEMLGLEWPQVDFDSGGLHVEKQISFDETGKAVEAELKTEESEAFVPMPSWYMDELKEFKARWDKEREDIGTKWVAGEKQYLFHGKFGDKYYPGTATATWRKFLNRHELTQIRLHDLRHTTAMLLRLDGVEMKSIQERLRHTKVATTADIYTHESEQIGRQTADRFERFNPRNMRISD